MVIKKNIKEVMPDEIIGEDIYVDNLLIISKGTRLSKNIISRLKSRNIQEIKIVNALKDTETESLDEPTPSENGNYLTPSFKEVSKVHDTFLETLSLIGFEYRYGKMLHEEEDVLFLIHLFESFHQSNIFNNIFYTLKSWDNYTFIHSFDVFIIGGLIAKKLRLPNIKETALGFLLHDIGKINLPQSLLNKPGILSYKEFEEIKTHTVEGEILLKQLGLENIAHFARLHHERMDGTGYPDKLSAQELSEELRILHIVDVYSALTLKRPYKDSITGQEALNILYRDSHLYDEDILSTLSEYLSIYPTESTVLLSDNTEAIVKKSSAFSTTPIVKSIDKNETFILPINYDITISKMIDFHSVPFQSRYKKFLHHLFEGNKQNAYDEFFKLIDGFKLEDIYTNILLPSHWKLTNIVEKNQMTRQKYLEVTAILNDLLLNLEKEMIKTNHYDFKVALLVEETIKNTMTIKLIANLLHVEGVFPIVLDYQNQANSLDLNKFISESNVENLAFFSLSNHKKRMSESNPILNLNASHKSYDELLHILSNVSETKGTSLQIYDHLFNDNR